MKKLVWLLAVFFILTSFDNKLTTECDIASFYSGYEPDRGSKVLTDRDELEEASLILTPTSVKTGTYVVNITRKGENLYKVDDKNIYIETKYCYEYATHQEVVLKVTSSFGYSLGKIIF